MPCSVDFFFEFASPYSYIAAQQLPAIAARTGRIVRWRPIEIGKVWAAQGILDAYRAIQRVKRGYIQTDARRVAAELGIELARPAVFPPDATLGRLAVHGLEAEAPGLGGALAIGLWRRFWGQGRDISTMDDLIAAAPDGIGPNLVRGAAETADARNGLDAANADAVASSCFGVPWLVADGEAYFGQDRLAMMERRLAT